MELKYKNNSKIISSEPKQNKVRPFSSNPLNRKNPKPSFNPRIKSGLPKLNNEFIQSNTNEIHFLDDKSKKFDSNNEFHNNMNFRRTRPKSRYQDKIFNRYWESNATEPKTIFSKNKKKLNKLNIETEKELKEIEKLKNNLTTAIELILNFQKQQWILRVLIVALIY